MGLRFVKQLSTIIWQIEHLNHLKPYCQEATFYARKAIEMQEFLFKIALAEMQIIDEKGEETPSK